MKYFNIILIGVIVIGLVAALFFFFSTTRPTPETVVENGITSETISSEQASAINEIGEPADFVRAFYKWYMPFVTKDISFSTTDTFKKSAANWVTSDFLLVATGANSEDPFLLVTDTSSEWTTVTTTLLNLSSAEATVLVEFGTELDAHKVIASLVREGMKWRIDSIATLPDGGI